jgi:hypothetical protein
MKWTKIVSRISATGIIAYNSFWFIPILIREQEWRWLENSYNVFTVLLIIPAILAWLSRNKSDYVLFVINGFGLLWTLLDLMIMMADLTIG